MKSLKKLIDKALHELSENGRSDGKRMDEKWSDLSFILHEIEDISDKYEVEMKEQIIEDVAKEILIPHGIDLKTITDRYRD